MEAGAEKKSRKKLFAILGVAALIVLAAVVLYLFYIPRGGVVLG